MSTKSKTSEQETIRRLKEANAAQATSVKVYQEEIVRMHGLIDQLTRQRNDAVATVARIIPQNNDLRQQIEGLRTAKIHLEGRVHGLESAFRNLSHN